MIAKSTHLPSWPTAELTSLRGELAGCLSSIAALLRDEGGLDDALALRLAQYADCALGEDRPEVASIVIRLRAPLPEPNHMAEVTNLLTMFSQAPPHQGEPGPAS